MNILLGGNGFIGTRLASELLKAGQPVVSFDRQAGELKGVDYQVADLAQDQLDQTLLNQAERIYVLFGQIYPDFSIEQELELLGRVATQLQQSRARIYFFSTALVYGACRTRASESAPAKPVGDYANYKLAAEQLLQKLLPSERLTIFRLANIYGDPKNKGVISKIIQLGLRPTEEVMTIDRNRRDYLLVDDLVQVIISLQTKETKAIVNLGTGKSVAVEQIIQTVSQLTGQKIDFQVRQPDPKTDYDCLLNIALLGQYYPLNQLHTIEGGLKLAVDRYKV